MKNIYLLATLLLVFIACVPKTPEVPTTEAVKNFYYIEEFTYKKEQIVFFENEFKKILKLNNKEILETYLDFYKKNASYFINGLQKVEILENKLNEIQQIDNKNSQKELLLKASNSNKKDSIKIYLDLAKKDNIFAQRKLVEMYKITNPEIALKWLERLVLNEDTYSMKEYASGNIYMIRPIIVQDLEKALNTYKKLAQLGDLSSIMRLGNIYEYGYHKSVAPQDKLKSLEYYKLAASRNYEIAQKKLYEIYSCKECKPNRYDIKKANELQAILLKNLDKKIIAGLQEKEKTIPKLIKTKVITQKPSLENTKDKKPIKELKKEIVTPSKEETPLAKKKIEVVKCYDMEVGSSELNNKCKNKIQAFLEKGTKIEKIILIPVLDKNDINSFKENKEKKSFLDTLGKERALKVEGYLKNITKDTPKIKTYNYYVISKQSNKGVILKFY